MSLFKQNIAIDLGTATVLVSVGEKGVVIKEPSIVAVKEGTSEVIAIGEEARLMMGRTPFDITTGAPCTERRHIQLYDHQKNDCILFE